MKKLLPKILIFLVFAFFTYIVVFLYMNGDIIK